MSIPTGDFPVYAGEQHVGTVTISQNGLLTVFDCVCAYKSRDVLRLAAVCSGKPVPLGVLMPEDNALRLKKSFSKNALAGIGFDNANAFYLITPGDAGRVIDPPPAVPLHDEVPPAEFLPPEAAPPAAAEPALTSPDMPPLEMPITLASAEPDPAVLYSVEPEIQAVEPTVQSSAAAVDDGAPYGVFDVAAGDTDAAQPATEAPASGEAAVSTELADQLLSALIQMTSKKEEPAADSEPADGTAPPNEAGQPDEAETYDNIDIPIFDELEAYDDEATEYEDGWFLADQPSALFQDPDIAKTCEDITDALLMEQEDYTLLAVPVSHSKPFPMMSIFCFGTSRLIGRQEYIVFKIRNGYLTL